MKKMILWNVFIFSIVGLFFSCTTSRLFRMIHNPSTDSIMKKLEANQKIANVVFVDKEARDDQFRVGIELENGKKLTLIISGTLKIEGLVQIDNYVVKATGLKKKIDGWSVIYFDILYLECLELVLGYTPKSIDDMIDSYDHILAIVKTIFHEGRIPGKFWDDLDVWGDEAGLRKYTGYVTSNKYKFKIYVSDTPKQTNSVN
jgi:hypothetical protein